ncbi:Glycosyltransferase [Mucinivorans hirudinis]|uniref:Glycosyltransferase n=1 Tax=Mucinivorans hirudinis TaxID=1433126 RepID=A0A060RBB8_9BACT|nr:Glycosyltransferase [Mucinivorans hirudinis]
MIHLFFISYDFSGAETYAHQLIPYLRSKNGLAVYEVHFSSDYPEFAVENVGECAASGLGWKFYFPKIASKYLIDRGYADVFIAPPVLILWEWLKNCIGDTVIFHSNSEDFVNVLNKARGLVDFRTVSTIHFLPKHYSWKELDNYTETLTETKNDNYIRQLELSDKIICVTEFAAASIKKNDAVSADRVSVIYNGYSSDNSPKKVSRGKYGLSDNDIVLLFVGRITPEKGICGLLTAFRDISAEFSQVRLLLVGDGDVKLVDAFLAGCEGSLVYMGRQSKEVVAELYDLADIGIIPSKYEQCSYVALEMMSRRLAVIATNTPGLRELFVDEHSGLLMDISRGYDANELLDIFIDVDMLKKQIVRLICDSTLRSYIGRNGYQRWQEMFTAERMAEQTYNLYKSLIVP